MFSVRTKATSGATRMSGWRDKTNPPSAPKTSPRSCSSLNRVSSVPIIIATRLESATEGLTSRNSPSMNSSGTSPPHFCTTSSRVQSFVVTVIASSPSFGQRVGEDVTNRNAQTGDDVLAGELVVLGQGLLLLAQSAYDYHAPLGNGDQDQAHASLKIELDLLHDLAEMVRWRHHFEREIGRHRKVVLVVEGRRNPLAPDEADVRRNNGTTIRKEYEPSISAGHPSELEPHREIVEGRTDVEGDYRRFGTRWTHFAQLPANEFVISWHRQQVIGGERSGRDHVVLPYLALGRRFCPAS